MAWINNPVAVMNVDRDAECTVRFRVQATMKLSGLPDNVKRTLLRALSQGYTSALSGTPVYYYNVLAHVFDFPVYSLGRTDRCILSYPSDKSDKWVEELKAWAKNMWQLTLPRETHENYYRYGFHAWTYEGHNSNWKQMVVTRPRELKMEVICGYLGVDSVRELVPLPNRLRAILAVEQGDEIDVSGLIRREVG
jgi:hypothetical protein